MFHYILVFPCSDPIVPNFPWCPEQSWFSSSCPAVTESAGRHRMRTIVGSAHDVICLSESGALPFLLQLPLPWTLDRGSSCTQVATGGLALCSCPSGPRRAQPPGCASPPGSLAPAPTSPTLVPCHSLFCSNCKCPVRMGVFHFAFFLC